MSSYNWYGIMLNRHNGILKRKRDERPKGGHHLTAEQSAFSTNPFAPWPLQGFPDRHLSLCTLYGMVQEWKFGAVQKSYYSTTRVFTSRKPFESY
jgi:hypothetical protein